MTKQQDEQAPELAYIKLLSNGELAAYRADIRKEHRDGRPVYEYSLLQQQPASGRCVESILRRLCAEHPHIEFVEGVLGGVQPLINRHRIGVSHLLGRMAIGMSVAEYQETWGFDDETLKDAFAYTQDVIDALIDRERTGAATTAAEGGRAPIDVTKQHDFVQIVGRDSCGLRGCELGVLEHAWIPPLFTAAPAAACEGQPRACICPQESHTVGGWTARYRLPKCPVHGTPTTAAGPRNEAAIALLDKWLAEHPRVEHDGLLERLRRMINENSLSDREHYPPDTTSPGDAARDEDHACPFCNERGFDLIGLKSHLQNGDCEEFEKLERLRRL